MKNRSFCDINQGRAEMSTRLFIWKLQEIFINSVCPLQALSETSFFPLRQGKRPCTSKKSTSVTFRKTIIQPYKIIAFPVN